MSELRVRDVMHEGVISCTPDASLTEVATIMRERRISALVVMVDGFATGVISQTDLVNAAYVQPYMRYWSGLTARHLMTSPVVSVRADAPLSHALEMLRLHAIHRVVVTEPDDGGERPVGILSLTDVARAAGDTGAAVALRTEQS